MNMSGKPIPNLSDLMGSNERAERYAVTFLWRRRSVRPGFTAATGRTSVRRPTHPRPYHEQQPKA